MQVSLNTKRQAKGHQREDSPLTRKHRPRDLGMTGTRSAEGWNLCSFAVHTEDKSTCSIMCPRYHE